MVKSQSKEFVIQKFLKVASSGDYVHYLLFLEVSENSKKTEYKILVRCSNTLTAIWGAALMASGGADLSLSIYETARERILETFENHQKTVDTSPLEIVLTTYNAPSKPPVSQHSFPDTISRSVTVFPETLTLTAGLPQGEARAASFLRNSIAELRDAINSLTKIKTGWDFKLLEINEERAIVDVYLSCDTDAEFKVRILALRNLLSWMNQDAMEKIINDGVDRSGTVNWLEALLKKEFSDSRVDEIINKSRCLINLSAGYPTHTDSRRVLAAYKELNIEFPVRDFKDAWETILNTYRESLELLLQLLKK